MYEMFSLTSVGNARELGGYKTKDGAVVKYGVLLRTANLNTVTKEDLQALTSLYHLGVLVDFRSSLEIKDAPDPLLRDVEYVNIQVLDGNATFSDELKAELYALQLKGTNKIEEFKLLIKHGVLTDRLYIDFLSSDIGKAGYSRFFKVLNSLPEDKSVLFHCTQGKDRTGCAAMLILFALGADEETVLHDYALTNVYNAELIANERKYLQEQGVEDIELYLSAMDQVNPVFMQNAIDWMKKNYGSPLGYIEKELGVTSEDIRTLKKKFLDCYPQL